MDPISSSTFYGRKPTQKMRGIISVNTWVLVILVQSQCSLVSNAFKLTLSQNAFPWIKRSTFFQNIMIQTSSSSLAFVTGNNKVDKSQSNLSRLQMSDQEGTTTSRVAYRSLSIPLKEFDNTQIPVAVWYPMTTSQENPDVVVPAQYKHSISIPRIGELLAALDFLPSFLQKGYNLDPTLNKLYNDNVRVVDGTDIPLPSGKKSVPVIFLAHGYLGSRFDLSHLGESLAQQGKKA